MRLSGQAEPNYQDDDESETDEEASLNGEAQSNTQESQDEW